MTKSFMLAAGVVCAALAACATKPVAAPLDVKYQVVREDVSIPFTSTVRNFRVGLDRSLLLESGHDRWYRATLPQPCKSDLRWEQQIALADRASTSVSKFTDVIVDGQRCQILTLDEIANPRAAEDLARAVAAAAEAARPAT
jgi:hypothetical protein